MEPQLKLKRSLKWGAIGFAIPIVVLGAVFGLPLVFGDIHPLDRENDIARMPGTLLIPAIGCAFVFALAAYASSVEAPRITLMRAILITALSVFVAKLVVTPSPRYKMPDPNAWLEIAVPVVVGLITCAILLAINRRGKPAT